MLAWEGACGAHLVHGVGRWMWFQERVEDFLRHQMGSHLVRQSLRQAGKKQDWRWIGMMPKSLPYKNFTRNKFEYSLYPEGHGKPTESKKYNEDKSGSDNDYESLSYSVVKLTQDSQRKQYHITRQAYLFDWISPSWFDSRVWTWFESLVPTWFYSLVPTWFH